MSSSRNMENLELEKTWNITNEYIIKLINTLEEGNLEMFNSSAEVMAIYQAGYSFASRLSCIEAENRLIQIYKK